MLKPQMHPAALMALLPGASRPSPERIGAVVKVLMVLATCTTLALVFGLWAESMLSEAVREPRESWAPLAWAALGLLGGTCALLLPSSFRYHIGSPS